MPIVEARIEIKAPQADLFDLTQDYGMRLRWDPFLRELKFRDGAAAAAVGVKAWVRARNGLAMEVVYLTYDRPRSVAMQMTDGPVVFERFAGSWRFERLDEARTCVVFRYSFETRWRWLRPVLDRAVTALFGRDVRLRLRGLKRAAEQTGLLDELRRARAKAEAAPPP